MDTNSATDRLLDPGWWDADWDAHFQDKIFEHHQNIGMAILSIIQQANEPQIPAFIGMITRLYPQHLNKAKTYLVLR